MSIFSKLFREQSGSELEQVVQISDGPGQYAVDVVGASYHQEELEEICGGRTEDSQRLETVAILVLEDDNKYDKNAILVTIEGHGVGHLDRETAKSFRQQMSKATPGVKKITCQAIIVGGWDRGDGDRGHFGVKLNLPID